MMKERISDASSSVAGKTRIAAEASFTAAVSIWRRTVSMTSLLRTPLINRGTMQLRWLAFTLAVTLAGCTPQGAQYTETKRDSALRPRLPTGVYLDPAGRSFSAGSMPLAMVLSPDGNRIVLLLNGWGEQGVQVLDRGTGAIVQTLPQASAFLGLVFSPDGNWLYASGGNDDVVIKYKWANARGEIADTITITEKPKNRDGTRYPAGIGVSPSGKTLYVAENLADSVAVVDL